MANIKPALRQLRRTRKRVAPPESQHFEEYRPAYEAILTATADLAGEDGLTALKDWMIQTTTDTKRLPHPAAVRDKARELCDSQDITIPADSVLSTE